MKKIILILCLLTSLTTMARFEEQYGANEIKHQEYENGVVSKTFSTKNSNHIYEVETFKSSKNAEEYFQNILNVVEEEKKIKVLDYTDIFGIKKITFFTEKKLIVISKSNKEVSQLILNINTLDEAVNFGQYLKLNNVHGSIELTILNAKTDYIMRNIK